MTRFTFALLAPAPAVLLGCPSSNRSKVEPGKTDAKTETTPKQPRKLGESCSTEVPFQQGDCTEGLLCGPGPGGICTSLRGLGGSCEAPGLWIDTIRAGELCSAPCKTDKDCRASEGYTCDAAWGARALPGFPSPKPPVCNAKPLVKKSFGPVRQIEVAREVLPTRFAKAAARRVRQMKPSAMLHLQVIASDASRPNGTANITQSRSIPMQKYCMSSDAVRERKQRIAFPHLPRRSQALKFGSAGFAPFRSSANPRPSIRNDLISTTNAEHRRNGSMPSPPPTRVRLTNGRHKYR